MTGDAIRSGFLAAGEFAHLVRQLVRQLATGRLEVASEAGIRHLWLTAGQTRSVVSELEAEKLGKWLANRGVIEPHRMAISLLRLPEGVRFGAFLVQEGLLSLERLGQELETLSVSIASQMLFDAGDYRFHVGEELPPDAASLEMTTASLLAAAVRAVPNDGRLETLLDMGAYVWGAQDALLLFQDVRLTPQEGYLLSRVDGKATTAELSRVVGLPPDEVTRALAVLVVAGLVELREGPAVRAEVPSVVARPLEAPAVEKLQYSPQQQREYADVIRLAAECRRSGYYHRLGISPGATQDQIHARFLELARLWHPDRAHDPHLRSLRYELAEVFTAMQEAYEILSNPERRARYDRSLRGESLEQTDKIREEERRRPARAELAHANLDRARQLIRVGDVGMAVELLDQAARMNPDAETLLLLARLELRNPLWTQRALDHLKHAVALSPRCTEAWLELANFWGTRDQKESQRECLNKVLQYDPANQDVQAALAGVTQTKRKKRSRP